MSNRTDESVSCEDGSPGVFGECVPNCEATAHVFLPPVAPVRMHRELGLTDGQVSIPIPNSDSAAVSGRFFLLTAGTGRCDPPGLTNWAPFAGEGRPNLATGG